MSDAAASAAVGPPPGMKVRLSSNESAWGPSPRAVEAATPVLARGHLYPDDQAVDLRHGIAAHEKADLAQVSVGTGSAALLMDTIQHACADGRGEVLAFERSFVVYRLGARNAGVPYVEAPTVGPATTDRAGYGRDPQALLDHVTDATRVVCIDNPGNPTGAHLPGDDLRAVVAALPEGVTVVVDEAYHHFAAGHDGYATVAELGLSHPRLLVMRTFSKAYGLAGMRIGYVVGPSELVGAIDQWRSRFNVTAPSQAAALAALDDHVHLERTVAGTLEGRQRMQDWLAEQGVPFTPSLGNFVTIELDRPAPEVVEAFAAHGVGVRPLAPYGMDRQVRVSVGTPPELDAFLEAAGDVLAG